MQDLQNVKVEPFLVVSASVPVNWSCLQDSWIGCKSGKHRHRRHEALRVLGLLVESSVTTGLKLTLQTAFPPHSTKKKHPVLRLMACALVIQAGRWPLADVRALAADNS